MSPLAPGSSSRSSEATISSLWSRRFVVLGHSSRVLVPLHAPNLHSSLHVFIARASFPFTRAFLSAPSARSACVLLVPLHVGARSGHRGGLLPFPAVSRASCTPSTDVVVVSPVTSTPTPCPRSGAVLRIRASAVGSRCQPAVYHKSWLVPAAIACRGCQRTRGVKHESSVSSDMSKSEIVASVKRKICIEAAMSLPKYIVSLIGKVGCTDMTYQEIMPDMSVKKGRADAAPVADEERRGQGAWTGMKTMMRTMSMMSIAWKIVLASVILILGALQDLWVS
ncbi:hypothetical protein GUJ93_ZPchr0012g20812 [Zizania palustris]|uniref:Uncharacterized protein n=1 Tax=Zizania palustris TaxID=103762 RepID=A0A8J5WXS1_ZIZPA|nr:hypothetical protein GUJ93_ZPchr0012g20812 [Zizania palustris]